jgi:Spy/CpxP family protein refolding chaperone
MTGDRISWSNPRVLAVLLLVFVTGTLSGAIAYRVVRSRVARMGQASAGGGPSWSNKEGFLARYKKELNLTDEQTVKMSKVLDDYKMYYQNLQEQLEEVRSTGKSDILKILDENQRQKFEKLIPESK